jgi:arylsulfatase
MRVRFWVAFAVMACLGSVAAADTTGQGAKRPNFLLLVADDMGFTDVGSYGGEIATPVLDQLARGGVRFTEFYVSPTCSPTRSMLLSGTDMHVAGLGNMDTLLAPNQLGQPGYEGVLNQRVVTVASLLRDGGYHTYMAGKWHLGYEADEIPRARGFERDFSLLPGGGSHFDDRWNLEWQRPTAPYTEDGRLLEKLPGGFYSTKTFTDKMMDFIGSNRGDGKPFLAYMAYTAPHGPLHVPDEWLRRYKSRYDLGWDVVREVRFRRLKELGLIDEGVERAPRLWYLPRSIDLTPAASSVLGRKMELYASMVEYLDKDIGRLFDYLKEIGEYENTVVIFLSDNGAEGNDLRAMLSGRPGTRGYLHAARNFAEDDPFMWGRKGTYAEYGPGWATAAMTPFRLYKGFLTEGGIRSPLIVGGPGVRGAGRINRKAVLHVMDIAPTMLELAGIRHPDTYKGRDVLPMAGKSWVSTLAGEAESPRGPKDWLGFEFIGMRALRQGDWKLLWLHEPWGIGDWQVFNLADDPAEMRDLSSQNPEKKRELLAAWEAYVKQFNIIPSNRHAFEQARKHLPARFDPQTEEFPVLVGPTAGQYQKLLEMYEKQARKHYTWR